MPLTRRLALATLTLGVVGCASSPIVNGLPADAPKAPDPTAPTQEPHTAKAAAEVGRLRDVLAPLAALTDLPEHGWAAAAVAQCEAHLSRLSVPDPLSDDEQDPFPLPTAPPAPTPTGLDAAVTAQISATVQALSDAAATQSDPDLRLLFASAATATNGLLNPASTPVAGDGSPRRTQATTRRASLPITLGHAWALIYGLGVGIGRLDGKDPLRALGTARLAAAKELRNELRAELTGEPPEQPAVFELPTAMDDVDSIREGLAVLEMNLLNGYGRLVAADADAAWRQRMLDQVSAVQAVGGTLPHWPGWVA